MIRWTKDGKVERIWDGNPEWVDELADALDVAVAALRQTLDFWRASGPLTADDVQSKVEEALRKIGVEQ